MTLFALAIFYIYIGGIAFTAWGFMLAVGIAHSEWLTSMPTVGYSTSFWIWFTFSVFPTLFSLIMQFIKAANE